jgi:hypothetical protein
MILQLLAIITLVFGSLPVIAGVSDCSDVLDYGRYEHFHNTSNWEHHGTMMIESISSCQKGTCFSGQWRIDDMAANETNPISGWYDGSLFFMKRQMGKEVQVWKGICQSEGIKGTFTDIRWTGAFKINREW